ncbi:MAG: hypothetical protein WDN69_16690 [Aliidongia sp.]
MRHWPSSLTSNSRPRRGSIGNGAFEGGIIAPLGVTLPGDFTLILMPEFDELKDDDGSGRHANFAGLINLSHEIVDGLTGYADFFSSAAEDEGGKPIYTADYCGLPMPSRRRFSSIPGRISGFPARRRRCSFISASRNGFEEMMPGEAPSFARHPASNDEDRTVNATSRTRIADTGMSLS